MPRTNSGRKGSKLVRTITGYAGEQKFSPEDLARPGLCGMTIRRRLKSPGDFRLDDILYLGRKLNIPIEELRECIHY